jgi:hypothetical protein
MRLQTAVCIAVFAVAGPLSGGAKESQLAVPEMRQAPDVLGKLVFAKGYTDVGLSPVYRIDKEVVFSGQVLAATTIEFAAGAQLKFSSNLGDLTERYIVANVIRVAAGQTPVITWLRDQPSAYPSLPPGKGQPGSSSGIDGGDGAAGAKGLTGNPGVSGRSAPTIYLVVGRVEGGAIAVDLTGQNGGEGGPGQVGGDGANGRNGTSGVPGLIDCRAGGGKGGNGGPGGAGGDGGPGGRGGNGGTFVLLTSASTLPVLARAFQVDVTPGDGGHGSGPGAGGHGGHGGQGGSGVGLCGGGPPGGDGAAGREGGPGTQGAPGLKGQYLTVPLLDSQLRALAIGGGIIGKQ